ncbi:MULTISPECIES: FMN-binding negative transcriptional regulator [unclassified Leifsonia]|uniref:FMN-binding negative transcriptional regulator n=1 Tax=unclassified Leifsonia TaxID=2663824 RepID=UPI0006F37397|nr:MULTISPECIES: FMN-binding negative transcriptional regulator [unclassified Leifsonia]KQX07123.1 transcriptional regulator [Leifsonia sp. Root1293]KRA11406.1 transcriptional regulator [Leifsonia sp. Root60]
MRANPSFLLASDEVVKRLIRENPWATIVSRTDAGELVASHYPIVLREDLDGIVVESHVGRPDEQLHELGRHEVLIVVQGPHGYISPGWYDGGPAVPTWNFVVAHLHGTPEILSDAENLQVLERLVDHFEDRMPEPFRMNRTLENAAYAERIVVGTVGFRMKVDSFVAKDKMSQNRPPATVDRIIDELENGSVYTNRELAREMRRARGETV